MHNTFSYKDPSGISVTIIADSIAPGGTRMTTMEIEYPRFILAELNTHRMLSKNSASSRAIPVTAMKDTLIATPVFWGKNQPGMKAKEQIGDISKANLLWEAAKNMAIGYADMLRGLDLHKQLTNRITEPWMMMKTVISGTEWANFFYLRNHPDAQPELQRLASLMFKAYMESTPRELYAGEWHLPYVDTQRDKLGTLFYRGAEGEELSLEDARVVSASCCAQVSYRKSDDTLEKAKRIYHQLIESTPAHASPVEHQATPMHRFNDKFDPDCWQEGITHVSANGDFWSGNLRDWVQFRKLIPHEAVWNIQLALPTEEEPDSI